MKTLRRYNLPNQYYFITIVTHKRKPILLHDVLLFWNSWNYRKLDFWVILPDHFHCILNVKNDPISDIIHNFKIRYSRFYRDKYRPGKVWQNRFWEHMIRNEKDMINHINYLHYNPVKHQLIDNLFEWNHSSIHKFDSEEYECSKISVDCIDFNRDYGE